MNANNWKPNYRYVHVYNISGINLIWESWESHCPIVLFFKRHDENSLIWCCSRYVPSTNWYTTTLRFVCTIVSLIVLEVTIIVSELPNSVLGVPRAHIPGISCILSFYDGRLYY
jgi:hypothetical protein